MYVIKTLTLCKQKVKIYAIKTLCCYVFCFSCTELSQVKIVIC